MVISAYSGRIFRTVVYVELVAIFLPIAADVVNISYVIIIVHTKIRINTLIRHRIHTDRDATTRTGCNFLRVPSNGGKLQRSSVERRDMGNFRINSASHSIFFQL